jgi:hypothetical protein
MGWVDGGGLQLHDKNLEVIVRFVTVCFEAQNCLV